MQIAWRRLYAQTLSTRQWLCFYPSHETSLEIIELNPIVFQFTAPLANWDRFSPRYRDLEYFDCLANNTQMALF